MADTIKSALLVDYDSVFRSIAAAEPDVADRFAARIPAWIAALEAGRLVTSGDGAAVKRKILLRRCYAEPAVLGDRRGQFIAAGFQVIDCPAQEGRARNAADIHMVLDTIDALDHPAAYDEFILLSADSDFSPVLLRLRTHNRATIIYARSENAAAYGAIADGIFEERPLLALLSSSTRETAAEPAAARSEGSRAETPAADRAEIEALARKVNTATSVPLFSPKSYAELFRVLTEEVAKNGYHFQKTAENVAETLAASGRNVTRRQIVFIVKGLALKGHVFSNTDTPERLADVFRDQVLYLIRNGGLDLSDRELAILPAWIVGRTTSAAAAEAVDMIGETGEDDTKPAKTPASPKPNVAKVPPKPIDDQAARAARRKPGKPIVNGKPETPAPVPAIAKPATPPPRPEPAKPVIAPRPTTIVKPAVPLPKSAAPQPAKSASAPAAIAAPPPPPRPLTSITAKPPADRPTVIKPLSEKSQPGADKEAVESTILAAIAQAVDVLVEDSGPQTRSDPPKAAPPEPAKPAPAPAAQAADPDDGDIGEEIQKIIASYNRDRQQGDQ
jgi:hypothetical protein